MTKLCALTLLVLLGSAAAADDPYNQVIERHAGCTEAAAVVLVAKKGEVKRDEVYGLAREALEACTAEEAEIAKLVSPEALQQVRSRALCVRIVATHEMRERREGPQRIYCAACGMNPNVDDRLRIWRPYRQ